MSDQPEGMTPIELLHRRLKKYQGHIVLIYAQVDREGQPVVTAIQDIGRAEKLSKEENDTDDLVNLKG